MKTSLTLLFTLFFFQPLVFSQWSIAEIKNTHSGKLKEAASNEIIEIKLEYKTSKAPALPEDLHLYINGNLIGDIKAFGIDTTRKRMYFLLNEKALAGYKKPGKGSVDLRVDVGTASENFTKSTTTKENLTLSFPKEKVLLSKTKLRLDEVLMVEIHDYPSFSRLPEASTDLRLYLGDQLQKNATLEGVTEGAPAIISFRLNGSEVVKKIYRNSATEKIKVGIGTENRQILSAYNELELIVISSSSHLASLGAALALFFALYLLARNTSLIRDNFTVECPRDKRYPDGIRRPFSYARTQLAFWTYVILTSFIYIWATTKELAFLPNSALVLLGISITVTAAGRIIDETNPNRVELEEKKSKASKQNNSWLFFIELLTDGSGISIHRVQNFVFTLFLGFVFCWEVYHNFEMPSFDPELLLLMGISAGGYVGIKGWESRPPAQ